MISIKTDDQIARMRESGKITKDVLELIGKSIKVGMTTKELDKIAYDYIKSCGAIPSFLGYGGYPASICASVDEMVVHGIPSDGVFITFLSENSSTTITDEPPPSKLSAV